MTERILSFELTDEQMNYLTQQSISSDWLRDLNIRGENVVEGNLDAVERLREHLTERLALVGFDKDYVLTAEGEMLEQIIDALYVP
jgi:hypothetical protein